MIESLQKYLNQNDLSTNFFRSSSLAQKKRRTNNLVKNIESKYSIPDKYNVNNIHLGLKNPMTAYIYWEYTFDRINKTLFKAGYEDIREVVLLLRVYSIDRNNKVEKYNDIRVELDDSNLYLDDLKVGHSYTVELGILNSEEKFFPIIKSNQIDL
ncbi:DUF4912 domain-containing protein [Orenia marismortui]|uniref:Uncharacterized protein DUF4912 n=1 Tax=Orenia marismortui TaxID=46469 RepID=A0A4R8GRF3_9FIRM|nr:DUF4912 domain-containing protein [Orenia marismortui]TDX48405.1 uncharacterized protein DUF4912 [Orenia marismortui]